MPKSVTKTPKSKRPASKPLNKPSAKKSPKPGGKYDEIRKDLDQQRVELLQEAGAALTNRPEFAAFPDLSDQATAEVDSNFELRLKEREQKLLKKIDEALDRIATNTYGICERCGEEIPYKRLKARPVTTLCIECKTQQEEEEKIRA
jgi:DnaK suppressor protein